MIDQIEALTIPSAGQQFVGDDFRLLLNPGVYVFMVGDSILYVGYSDSLLRRAGDRRHGQAQKAQSECDKVLLYPCKNTHSARQLEHILIAKLCPRYNVNGRRQYIRQKLGIGRYSKVS